MVADDVRRGAVLVRNGQRIFAGMTDTPPPADPIETDPTQAPATSVVAVVDNYVDLMRALAIRRHELAMSQLEADHISGLPDGYVGKLECHVRRLGPLSLPSLLGALGLRLIVVRDTSFKLRSRGRACPRPTGIRPSQGSEC